MADYRLMVQFSNGEKRQYDVEPLFGKWTEFQALRQIEGLFDRVQVDVGGYGISWNDYLDLSSEELYDNGILRFG